ncbi:MAG TPA: hypothetical protein VMH22_11405 [bacterium]|nr:hypothetical protein [bacterium]
MKTAAKTATLLVGVVCMLVLGGRRPSRLSRRDQAGKLHLVR